MIFDIGDSARLAVTFANQSGVPTNPTAVVLTIWAPDGTVSTPAPANDSAGAYHYNLSLTQSGIYRFKWQGTGAIAAVEEGEVIVKPSILVAQPPGTIPVKTLIEAGLRLAGLMDAARRQASNEQLDEGVETFNSMMDSWRAQSWRVPVVTRVVFALSAGTRDYTIGPVGAGPSHFTAPRPPRLFHAGLVLTTQNPNPEWPLEVLSYEQYTEIRGKLWTSSWPSGVYLEPTFAAGNATLHFFPGPTTAPSVALYLEQNITEVSGLTAGLVLPPGHRKAIEENLALMIAARNPKTAKPGPTLRTDAAESLQVIEALNYRPTTKQSDFPHRAGRSDIYRGQ
jgi:hypothetical protein